MRNIALLVCVVAACVEVEPEPIEPVDQPAEVTPLLGGDPRRAPTFGVFEQHTALFGDEFTVCWMPEVFAMESKIPGGGLLHRTGELAVMHEWNRVGRVRFNVAWPQCDGTFHHIRIGVEPLSSNLPGSSALGDDALDIPVDQPTMRLRFGVPSGPCSGEPGSATCPLLPVADDTFTHAILHQFGHALGFRDENAHHGSTCNIVELLDDPERGLNGVEVFGFDAASVMNACSSATVLSSGDIRALHAFYPGVVALYSGGNFDHGSGGVGLPIFLGPGSYVTSAALPLTSISSLVVPPGYQVRICTVSTCAFAATTRQLASPFNNAIQNLQIVPTALAFDLPGFQGTSGVVTGGNAPFGAVGDNRMSSFFVPLTRSATLCAEPNGGLPCLGILFGGDPTQTAELSPDLDNEISSVILQPRTVSFTGLFNGESRAFGVGVAKGASLMTINSLAISGMEVRACTLEGTPTPISPGGAGDCRTYTQSVDLAANGHAPIRFLQMKLPPVIGP